MKRESELLFLAGCLGVAGETNRERLRNAVHHFGANKALHWQTPEDTAAKVFKGVFGEHP
jgi:hypothetical protein